MLEPMWQFNVRTPNPEALDDTLRQLPNAEAMVVVGSWDATSGVCTVRTFTDPEWVKFAIRSQGYAELLPPERGMFA